MSPRAFYLPALVLGLSTLHAHADVDGAPPATDAAEPATADTAASATDPLKEGEALVRDDRHLEALRVLGEDPSHTACYWRGRALMALKRYDEACDNFKNVPADHPLYPYAAKGIIFCAWKGVDSKFSSKVSHLTSSPNPEIAKLATAAVAEFELRHTKGGDAQALHVLREMEDKPAAFEPAMGLLEIEDLRKQGKYEEAAKAAKSIYDNRTLHSTLRQRALLALAEIYYSSGDPELGEETLLQFISANPDADLHILDDAFRRLAKHQAFVTSKYTAEYLRNWSQETDKPNRAALALLMRQRVILAGNDKEDNLALLATAAASRPDVPAARTVIMEYMRVLLAEGRQQEAARYLGYLAANPDSRYLFYKAACITPGTKEALDAYLECLECAPADLQPAAAANAFYNAYMTANKEVQDMLMAKKLPPHARCAMLLMAAKLTQVSDPFQLAKPALEEMAALNPTPEQKAEAELILHSIEVLGDPAGTLRKLQETEASEEFAEWTDEQKLCLYMLEMEAVENRPNNGASAKNAECIALSRHILENTKSDLIRTAFTFELCSRLSDAGQHEEAYALLGKLVASTKNQETKARALLLAAEEAAKLGSMEYFEKSLSLFDQCSRIPSPYQARAIARQANVLMWTNRTDEALHLLQILADKEDELDPGDRLLMYTVLADTYSMQGTEESLGLAKQASEKILATPGITPDWQARAHLQHASLCSRTNLHADALADYLAIVKTMNPAYRRLNKAEWFLLNYAGAGAVYEHLQLGQLQEAADLAAQMAERLALCPPGTIDKLELNQAAFARWAEEIRLSIP